MTRTAACHPGFAAGFPGVFGTHPLTGVADRPGVEVAEGDHGRVRSIDDVVAYVRRELAP